MIDGRGWTPVCLPVFKTGVNGAEPFGWVRLPHALAKQRAPGFTRRALYTITTDKRLPAEPNHLYRRHSQA